MCIFILPKGLIDFSFLNTEKEKGHLSAPLVLLMEIKAYLQHGPLGQHDAPTAQQFCTAAITEGADTAPRIRSAAVITILFICNTSKITTVKNLVVQLLAARAGRAAWCTHGAAVLPLGGCLNCGCCERGEAAKHQCSS